ncbi:MAG TPA: hypothetical protein VGJ48_27000 [Pyrinomonadaceae bacterium]
MKRRTLKKQIPELAQRLFKPVRKYLEASSRVNQDILYRYELGIEYCIVDLMRLHLVLDPIWPHRRRWLDGLSDEFCWERKNGVVHGSGKLFWGHWPEVGREISGLYFTTMLTLCARHGVEYIFRYGNGDHVRSYYSQRWCSTRV